MSVTISTKARFAMLLVATCCIAAPSTSNAWDGTDSDGNAVEIESGELVRPNLDINVYHSEKGYGTYTVESIQRYGSTVEVEVYDHDSGEYETLEMEN